MPRPSLQAFLNQFAPLTEADWALARPHFHLRTLHKGDHWLAPGAISREIALVDAGLLRLYDPFPEGQERTMLFFQKGSVAGDYFSFLTQTPTLRPVQALEPCQLWCIGREAL
jgi:CRP/FNR family transcriptional regulator, anaerobic regulatory protein